MTQAAPAAAAIARAAHARRGFTEDDEPVIAEPSATNARASPPTCISRRNCGAESTFPAQVAAILPSNTPIGSANVTVTYNGQTSAANKINVVKSALGVFTRNSQGTGPAIAQVFRSATDLPLNSLTNAAQSGNTLIVYGTGLGAISGADNTRPGASPISNATVNLAGITIQPAYAGRVPDFPGEDQINFVIPANAPRSCYVPLEVTSSGQPSNLVYVSIASVVLASLSWHLIERPLNDLKRFFPYVPDESRKETLRTIPEVASAAQP